MQKYTVAAFLTLMFITPLMAGGAQEQGREMPRGQGTELPGMDESDKLTLEGYLEIEDERIIKLVTDEETWNLMVPPEKMEELPIEEGSIITVEGFSMPGPPEAEKEEGNFLMATAVIIDGKTYELEGGRPEKGQGGPGGQGGRGGQGGGRG